MLGLKILFFVLIAIIGVYAGIGIRTVGTW